MKKLRMWVKVVLIGLAILILAFIFKLFYSFSVDTVNMCVEGGHTYEWCVKNVG